MAQINTTVVSFKKAAELLNRARGNASRETFEQTKYMDIYNFYFDGRKDFYHFTVIGFSIEMTKYVPGEDGLNYPVYRVVSDGS